MDKFAPWEGREGGKQQKQTHTTPTPPQKKTHKRESVTLWKEKYWALN